MSDLVKRLRKLIRYGREEGMKMDIVDEAADRIERLEAQIAELQGFAEFARGQIAAKDAALRAASALAVCGMAVDCYSRDEIAEMSRATRPTFIEVLTAPAQEDKP